MTSRALVFFLGLHLLVAAAGVKTQRRGTTNHTMYASASTEEQSQVAATQSQGPSTSKTERACAQLFMAYLAGIPVPVPIAPTALQAVALVTCCPGWVKDKVMAKVEAARAQNSTATEKVSELDLTDDALQAIRREEITQLYEKTAAEIAEKKRSVEQMTDTPEEKDHQEGPLRQDSAQRAAVRDLLARQIREAEEARDEIEQRNPWLVFPQLVELYLSWKSGGKDFGAEDDIVGQLDVLLVQIKLTNPWIPAMVNANLPVALRQDVPLEGAAFDEAEGGGEGGGGIRKKGCDMLANGVGWLAERLEGSSKGAKMTEEEIDRLLTRVRLGEFDVRSQD